MNLQKTWKEDLAVMPTDVVDTSGVRE
jgi:hypothetical protein